MPLRIGTLLLAWLIAMVLWGMAHGTSNTEVGVDIPIVFDGVPEDLVLVQQSARAVNVRVLGSRAALRDVGPSTIQYRIDVSGVQRGEAVYEVDAGRIEEQLPSGARIVSRSPASLELRFARRGRKSIRVRADLVGEPAAGHTVAWVEIDPAYVWLTGDRRQVRSLTEALTEAIEVRGLTGPIQREVRLSLPDHVWMEEPRPVQARIQIEALEPPPLGGVLVTGERTQRLFGTDGVRGRANVHPMTAEMSLALGQAVAHVFAEVGGSERRRIIIGKDTRLSGYLFEDALAAGICSMGVDVLQVGPMPTPGMAFLTADMRCDAGVMISASHNPYQDNGIKFFSRDGFKLPDAIEDRIEDLVTSGALAEHRADPDSIGSARRIDDVTGRYVVFLKKNFPREASLEGMRVVLDCAHGAAYKVGPTVMRELGAELFALGVDPNGRNINDGCGALYPGEAGDRVRETRADVGIALDGDADRCIMLDETGTPVDGDALIALLARDLHERGALAGGAVVATVMSNLGLERALARDGIGLVRTPVGDRYVVEAMRAGGHNLGGEQSGHIVMLDQNTTGDGLLTALQVLAIVRRTGQPLSKLIADFEAVPQVLVNVKVAEKRPVEDLPGFQRQLAAVESELGDKGRVLVRYSGTEPKARVMVEGDDEERVRRHADELAAALQQSLAGGERMRGLILELDALPSLRDATAAHDVDLAAAATLAELAGVDAVRLGVGPDMKPVTEEDLRDTRRAARRLELRMAPVEAMVRVALDVRPDLVLLASDRHEGANAASPLDWKSETAGLGAVARALNDAGIGVAARIAPTVDAVKAAHGAGMQGVELYTGSLVDLPANERTRELQQLGDAARLASKLRLDLGLGGGIGYRVLPELVEAAPAAERLAVGRAALTRAVLVGLDRALRDLRSLLT